MIRKNATHVMLLWMLTFQCLSQDSLSVNVVAKFSYPFNITNYRVIGAGWDSLKQDISESQFVLLGVNHSSPRLSELTAVLLKEMKLFGFQHFVIETGPIASDKIKSLYDPDENVYGARLYDFNSKYKLKTGSPPAEFMVMKQDAGMYKSAIENGYVIKGIDREYYSCSSYLFAELEKYCTTSTLKELYLKAQKKLTQFQAEDIANKSTTTHILKCHQDEAVQLFLQKISQTHRKAGIIVSQIRKCYEVYSLYANKQYKQSEEVKIANYKKNFGNYYYQNLDTKSKQFKALIKMGNMHTSKVESELGYFDIGNMIYQLAALNGTRSLHIENMRRYRYNEKGGVMDFINDGYEIYPNIMAQANLDQWVVVDLTALRQFIQLNKIKMNKYENAIIRKNDWVLLTPLDESYKSSLNYD